MNYKQQEEKEKKLATFLNAYRSLKNKVCGIKDLSNRLGQGFSRSTIQRYFHELYEKQMIDENEYMEIQEWLKNNQEKGYSTGGTISQQRYGYSKDDEGHFQGRKK